MYKQLRKELTGEGKLPLLNEFQLRFLDEVKEIVDRKVAEIAPIYLDEEENCVGSSINVIRKCLMISELQVISSAEKYLMKIIYHLKKAKKSLLGFIFANSLWEKKRQDCKVKLTEIADSINSERFNSNISKLIGYCTSAVGGIMILVSAILIHLSFDMTTNPPLVVAGGSMIFVGCVTTIGASVTELTRLKKKVDKAKKFIKENEESFQDLGDWLNHASDLQKALQSVLGINVLKDVADSVNKFVEEAVEIINDRERHKVIEKYISKILRTFLPLFRKMNIDISKVAPLLTVLVAICLLLLNTENRVVFDFASVTVKCVVGVASLVQESVNFYRLSNLILGSAAFGENLARAVTRGAVAIFGIALDAIGIVFVSKDIFTGSLSPEAKKIKDVIKNM